MPPGEARGPRASPSPRPVNYHPDGGQYLDFAW